MLDSSIKSYVPTFDLNKPIESTCITKVLRSNSASSKEGDLVIGHAPIQEVIALDIKNLARIHRLENPLGIKDIRVFLGALGMPGLNAYSSLYEIGKPKKGETIFVSAVSGAVGQLVGQPVKHEGLKVVGSVGSNEKLEYIIKELGFDSAFKYKTEKPADALDCLAPEDLDIYYENVGGEHLEAAFDAMNNFGRVVVCGLISQYDLNPYPITNIHNVLVKCLIIRVIIASDYGMGAVYTEKYQENMQEWIKDESFKVLIHETMGIDNAREGLIGIFYGRNMGKAVLKF